MFILGDETHDRGKIPWVTFTLISLNILMFAAQFRFGERLTNGYALTPKEITEFKDLVKNEPVKVPGHRVMVDIDDDGDVVFAQGPNRVLYIRHYPGPFPIVLTVFTYMFLHADFLHLLFNMWFLFVFGRNVECSLGAGRFFGFYIACGVLAGLSHVFTDMKSVVPMVGASGAIAGIMGAYLAIFPNNTVMVWIGGLLGGALSQRGSVFGGVVKLPAVGVIGFWFVGQYLAGIATMNVEMVGGTAYWCHIGGFLVGFCSIKGIVLYLRHEISKLEAEREEVEPLPNDALRAPEVPTIAQIDAILDPVQAYKNARANVFRDTEANDPFIRPEPASMVHSVDLAAEADDREHGITTSPKPRHQVDLAHAIVVHK